MCPGIFLPLKTLPGSSQLPIEPTALCVKLTPCDAFYIWKPHLLIAPCIPLPLLIDIVSTNYPILKCLGPKQ